MCSLWSLFAVETAIILIHHQPVHHQPTYVHLHYFKMLSPLMQHCFDTCPCAPVHHAQKSEQLGINEEPQRSGSSGAGAGELAPREFWRIGCSRAGAGEAPAKGDNIPPHGFIT